MLSPPICGSLSQRYRNINQSTSQVLCAYYDFIDTCGHQFLLLLFFLFIFFLGGEGFFKTGSFRVKVNSRGVTRPIQVSFCLVFVIVDQSSTQKIDVKAVMDTWTLQMGYPVISISREGSRVTLFQSRYLSFPNSVIKEEFKSPFGYDIVRYCQISAK